ncbi:hypothetical protein F7725_014528 [Dissostichus mawsoni]|uniref:Uncharacterized protein n=1 Tax=Dissostichus mawsoni TaxID=36200 RepID=A0A7J5YWJ8_DISMA|nr:hypothetical protein F7725_014528 [Dissostichus mawsoni]
MTSKYLIASVAMSASQTGLVFSHIHQPWVSEPAPVSSCPLSISPSSVSWRPTSGTSSEDERNPSGLYTPAR